MGAGSGRFTGTIGAGGGRPTGTGGAGGAFSGGTLYAATNMGTITDRETLPQYYKITSGASLNAGHSKGFETRDLRANDDILVYVKNRNIFAVPLEVKAGSSFTKNETQTRILAPGGDAVLRFKNHGQLTRYLSVDSQADSFLVEYQVYSRGYYAPR